MNPSMEWNLLAALVALLALLGLGIGFWLYRRRQGVRSVVGAAVAWLEGHPELRSQTIDCEGERIHYVQMGRGPDLVLLHGIGASLFTWRLVIQELAQNFRVTALDLPGFGRSSKNPDSDYGLDAQRKRILCFLDALQIDTAFLVGSSMGAAIALWVTHENSTRFPKVAVLAPATSPIFAPKRLTKLLSSTPYLHRTVNRQMVRWILRLVVARPELIQQEMIEAYLEPFLDEGVSARTFIAALDLLSDRRMPACYSGMKADVLIIAGRRDPLVRLTTISRLKTVLDRAEVVIHPTAGHHMMEDEPEWTARELTRFFSGT